MKAIIKFNGGRGALLCNKCNTIMQEDFDPATIEDKEYFCSPCNRGVPAGGCQATFTKYCHYPRCDCDRYVTNPTHGGKVTCYECDGFILEGDSVPYLDHQHRNEFPKVHFHRRCYNPYQHYHGLNKPID